MLEQESYTWLSYSVIFGLFSIVLFIQSIFYRHIMPFTLYSIIMTVGHIYIAITPFYTRSDIPWRKQDPILTQLPVCSILLFIGLVDWQFVYVRFIDTAFSNYKRWGSLHPVIINDIKSDDSRSEGSIQSNSGNQSEIEEGEFTDSIISSSTSLPPLELLSSLTVNLYLVVFVFYVIVTVAFLIANIIDGDSQTVSLISAICITFMSLFTIFNFIVVARISIKCSSKGIVGMLGQNRKKALALLLMPYLFMMMMLIIAVVSWMAYISTNSVTTKPFSLSSDDASSWIIFKVVLVYLPLFLLILCCILRRKHFKLVVDSRRHQTIAISP